MENAINKSKVFYIWKFIFQTFEKNILRIMINEDEIILSSLMKS